ncbi:hypothetical protein B296_00040320 [Ensete ventricosum]|uniref:Uncharacterized protein n=1 Tax=Ensete ventricosum TaxID=4639 RepID=A0A426ZQM4_ENSVE|nr:hypothetical protein B296_00040320 [Ensete ventricosum]
MRKRAASASAAAKSVAKGKSKGHDAFFTSPDPSSKPYHFDLPSFPTATAASCSLNTTPASYLRHPPSPPPSAKAMTTTLATISDLKALASSRTDSLKRHLDLCHSDILKDFDASNTRLSKRFKIVRAGFLSGIFKIRACCAQEPANPFCLVTRRRLSSAAAEEEKSRCWVASRGVGSLPRCDPPALVTAGSLPRFAVPPPPPLRHHPSSSFRR